MCIRDRYHSIRYVSGMTILRLNRKISYKTLELLNQKFKDILKGGVIKFTSPTAKEIEEGEYPDLPRLIMNFNMHDYGRLCAMIHVINSDPA